MKPDLSVEIELTPAFHDFDPMAIVWHGNYVKYLELSRDALLKKFDSDYQQMRDAGFVWPVVDLRLKYVKTTGFGQCIRIRAEIVEWEHRLKIEYVIRDSLTGHTITKASSIQVAVEVVSGELLYQCPEVLWRKLGIEVI